MSREPPDSPPSSGAAPEKNSFAQAASWSFVMQGGRQGLQVLFTFVLAALLGPEAYGVVAMALVFVMFVDMLQKQGMSAALIQRRNLTRSHLDTAFWLLVATSVVLVAATVAAAGLWAAANDTPSLRMIIIGLSPLIPLRNLSIVQDALLRREMAFKRLAQRDLVAIAAGGVVGIVTALAGWGPWALVAQQLTAAAVAVIVLWGVSDWRPGWSVSWTCAGELFAVSSGLLLSAIGNFLNNQADTILIGLFFGPRVVGVYRLGLRLVETLVALSSRSVQSVALPDLSPVADDPAELGRRIDRLTRLAAVTTVPVLGVLAGVATPLMDILGPEWAAAAVVAQVLCVVGVIRAWVVIDGPLLVATGSVFVQAAIAWLAGVLSAVAFIVAGVLLQGIPESGQAVGIAAARTGVWGLGIAAMHVWIMHRFAGQRLGQMLAPLRWPLLAGLMAAAIGVVTNSATGDESVLLRLVLSGGAAGLTAVAVSWLTMPWIREVAERALGAHRTRRAASESPEVVQRVEQ